MTQRFLDKVAVVIGGNSGIGLESAKAFAREGAQVVITGRHPETLDAAIDEIGHGAVAYRSDVSDVSQIRSTFSDIRQRFTCIDVLFVNAGILTISTIESVTEADWDAVQNVNLKGAFFSMQAALALMPKGSSMVLTGSTAGCQGMPTASVYAASKAGLRSLGRSFAAELIGRGIRVNVVSPGPTDTPIFQRTGGLSSDAMQTLRQSEIDGVPMRRMGTPLEIASAVLFLASDAAAFCTGTELLVDGGAVNCC